MAGDGSRSGAEAQRKVCRLVWVRCRCCGADFRTRSRLVKYCSERCRNEVRRERWHVAWRRKNGEARVCRQCSGPVDKLKTYCDVCLKQRVADQKRRYRERRLWEVSDG